MKVEKVSAHIRYSKALDDGQWKAIELSAEGSVDTKETWQGALSYLYAELGKELRTLWPSNGSKPAVAGAESHAPPPNPPEPAQSSAGPPEHYCEEHQVAYAEHKKGNQTWYSHKASWYSHKASDGAWCRE